MATQYAFFVDSDACSGCKTCQVACKDRNELRVGLYWRRVFEVTAGAWQRSGDAWTTTAVAYTLSTACHHCAEMPCAVQCSVEAIWKRPDGIVLLDQTRCVRCTRCVVDCPYDAIRYDAATNTLGKCDFCADAIDAGQPPACVAACPNRALDFGDLAELRRRPGTIDRVYPLPDPTRHQPALVIRPHRHAAAAQAREPEIANWEEL